jgi:PAS domain S-box-containing protein
MTSKINRPSSEELLAEITALREQVANLEQEKADMELMMKLTAEHSDSVAEELYSAVETTQRESEERFELIINAVPVPIIISQLPDDVIIYANVAMDELIGVEYGFLLNHTIKEFYNVAAERDEILAAMDASKAIDNREIKGIRCDGEPFWATLFARPLTFNDDPCLLEAYHNLSAHKQAEIERVNLQQEIIEAQQRAIQELSTPVIPIIDQIIVMPLVGSIDRDRAGEITRSLLAGISRHKAKIVIVDITGVPIIDTGVANYLTKTIRASQLKGAKTIVTGISEAVAETIVDLGIDWSEITTLSDLQTGLLLALKILGKKMV